MSTRKKEVLLGVLGWLAQLPKKKLKKIGITRTYNMPNTHDGENLSTKAYIEDTVSNKKLVWTSQFHSSAAD